MKGWREGWLTERPEERDMESTLSKHCDVTTCLKTAKSLRQSKDHHATSHTHTESTLKTFEHENIRQNNFRISMGTVE